MRRSPLLLLALAGGVMFLIPAAARADDLVTLTNQRFYDVRAERVEADGVIFRHQLGVVKLGFEELPPPVRRTYGYDPQRAADFQRVQRERAEENARLLREVETRRQEAFAKRQALLAAAGGVEGQTTGAFAYSNAVQGTGSESARAAAAVVGEQLQRWRAAEEKRNDPTPWNEKNWKLLPTLVQPASAGSQINVESPFFTPNYSKRAFDDLYHDRGPGVK